MDQLIGFSTNCFNQSDVPYEERIRIGKELGCRALELGWVDRDPSFFEARTAIERGLTDGFDWLSLHGPGSTVPLARDERTKVIFNAIERNHRMRPLHCVVFHPDGIKDEAAFEGYTFPVGIENMDKNKTSFQLPDSLAPMLARHPEWKLVVDVNHCFVNDPSLQLAIDLFAQFHGGIAETHLSGFQTLHEPLFKTRQVEILQILPLYIPVIIESELSSTDEAREEYHYVIKNLNTKK